MSCQLEVVRFDIQSQPGVHQDRVVNAAERFSDPFWIGYMTLLMIRIVKDDFVPIGGRRVVEEIRVCICHTFRLRK